MNPKVFIFNADKKVSKGQSLAEYGLILALIAVVCIGALKTLSTSIGNKLTGIGTTITAAE